MRPFLALVLAALPLVAGCASPLAPGATAPQAEPPAPVPLVDPLAPGPLGVEWADYDAGEVTVGGTDANHSDYEYESRVRGRVWFPAEEGAFPLLVLLHGQHATCAMGEQEAVVRLDDCNDEAGFNSPYPNHLGYEYLATLLASHGYVVASILAHEVNNRNGAGDIGMWARGELVLATLDAFRGAAEGVPPEAAARADLTRVGLMGHSRGGEGVVTAVHVNLARPEAERHALRAIVALAPTDFNERGVQGVALLSLVPYCDGDVSTLHGLRTFDHSRLLDDATDKVQVLVRGTNHNFYNTRWYDDAGLPVWPGDDAAFSPLGPSCDLGRAHGGWRWTPEETQQESLVHVAGFLRWQAGGERGLAPHFTGELPLPDAACPLRRACADAVVVTAALAGKRPLLAVDDDVPPHVEAEGFDAVDACAGPECHPTVRSSAPALRLQWSGPATLRIRLDPADLRAMDVLTLRVAVPGWDEPGKPDVDLGVGLADGTGGSASVPASSYSTALQRTPDPYVQAGGLTLGSSKVALQAVRVPLADFAGVDLSDVREVVLSFEGEGTMLLTDVMAQPEPDVA